MRLYVPSLGMLLLLVGCSAGQPESAATIGPGTYTAADGATMPYEVSGAGETTVVLIHCWMCDSSFWDEQVSVLAAKYRVVTLDLPGHGEGSDDRTQWSVVGYGDDVAGLIDELALEDVILVGHSMGGPVALRTAALAGDAVRAVVAVDTLHDAEFDFSGPQMQQMVAMFEQDFAASCAVMVDQMFVEGESPAVRDEVMRKGCTESNFVAGRALIADFGALDLPALFREAGVPIRAINAADGNPTQIETNRKYADFDAVLMPAVGHYLQMTRPERFNELLMETLDALD